MLVVLIKTDEKDITLQDIKTWTPGRTVESISIGTVGAGIASSILPFNRCNLPVQDRYDADEKLLLVAPSS